MKTRWGCVVVVALVFGQGCFGDDDARPDCGITFASNPIGIVRGQTDGVRVSFGPQDIDTIVHVESGDLTTSWTPAAPDSFPANATLNITCPDAVGTHTIEVSVVAAGECGDSLVVECIEPDPDIDAGIDTGFDAGPIVPPTNCSTEVPGLDPIAVIMSCVGGPIGGCAVAYKASGSTGEHFAFFIPNGCFATPYVLAGLSGRQEMACSDAGCILLHNGTNLEMSSITPSGTSPLMDLGVPSDTVLGIAPAYVDGEFRFYLAFANGGDVHRMDRNGVIEQTWTDATEFGTLSQERFFAFDDIFTDRLVTSAVGFVGTMRPHTLVQWTVDPSASTSTKTEYVVGMFSSTMPPEWDVTDTNEGRVRSWLMQPGSNLIEVATMAEDLSGPENETTIMIVGGTLEEYKVVRVRDAGTALIGRVNDGAGNISIRIFRLGDDIPAMLDVSMGDVIVEEDVGIYEAAAGNGLIGVYLWGATADVHQIVY